MITNIRPDADAFGHIVENLVRYADGGHYEGVFQAGSAPVRVHVPLHGHLILILQGELNDDWEAAHVRSIAIVPGPTADSDANLVVVEGKYVVGEFKGWHAAVSFALERACAPNWYAGAQHEHDACAV